MKKSKASENRSTTNAKGMAPYIRKITPPPALSPHVRQLMHAAYRCGWADRAQVEQDIRDGKIEAPGDEDKVEPSEFMTQLLASCRG